MTSTSSFLCRIAKTAIASCSLLLLSPVTASASGGGELCCEPPAQRYDHYYQTWQTPGVDLPLGGFMGVTLPFDTICIRWVDNSYGYMTPPHHANLMVQSFPGTGGYDSDLCATQEHLDLGGSGQIIGSSVNWQWTGMPGSGGGTGPNKNIFTAQIPPPDEIEVYNLEVEVTDIGGPCALIDTAPHLGNGTDSMEVVVWRPSHEFTWKYVATIPVDYVKVPPPMGGYYNGGEKVRFEQVMRIETAKTPAPGGASFNGTTLASSYCLSSGLNHPFNSDVWRQTGTLTFGRTLYWAYLYNQFYTCASWGLSGTPSTLLCDETADGDICIYFSRITADEVRSGKHGSSDVDFTNPCAPFFAPAITIYELDLKFRASINCEARELVYETEVYGMVDKFPRQEVFVDGLRVVEWDPCLGGATPFALFGTSAGRQILTGTWIPFRKVSF